MSKVKNEEMKEYDIDYEMYDTLELVKIFEFFSLIEKAKTKKVSKALIREKYQEYRNIVRNKALEKKYDQMLQTKSKVSIWEVVKNALEEK